MNKKTVYQCGYDTGYSIGCENYFDHFGKNKPNLETKFEFISICQQHESEIYRQYSPFEFFSHDINQSANRDDLWEVYEHGVYMGIKKSIRDNRVKKLSYRITQTVYIKDIQSDYILINLSQDVQFIKDYFSSMVVNKFDSFFVKIENGDYTDIIGFYGSVPYIDKNAYVIKSYWR